MKIELILSDEHVRLMQDVLDNKSGEMHVLAIECAREYVNAKNPKLKSASFDDWENLYRKSVMLESISGMIREQYNTNKRKL